MSIYERCNQQADTAKATHAARTAALCEQHGVDYRADWWRWVEVADSEDYIDVVHRPTEWAALVGDSEFEGSGLHWLAPLRRIAERKQAFARLMAGLQERDDVEQQRMRTAMQRHAGLKPLRDERGFPEFDRMGNYIMVT